MAARGARQTVRKTGGFSKPMGNVAANQAAAQNRQAQKVGGQHAVKGTKVSNRNQPRGSSRGGPQPAAT
jgi:hypothetical protein